MNALFSRLAGLGLVVMMSACSIDKKPYNGLPEDAVLQNAQGLRAATDGNYMFIKDSDYTRNLYIMNEYPGDNVTLSGTTTDPLFLTYTYRRTSDQGNALQIYRKGYQAIVGCNKVIGSIKEGSSKELDQILGENLFLRAMVHFDLVRLFGRPYAQSPETNLGIIIKTDTKADDNASRATVKEVYTFVVSELQKAARLMTVNRTNSYASPAAANALLSRVYLYMNDNTNAIKYADGVITEGRFALATPTQVPDFYAVENEQNKEIIFAIKHTLKDDRTWSSIGSMYYTSPGGVGWGEVYASQAFQDLVNKYPNDQRRSYLVRKLTAQGVQEKRNGIDKVYVTKFSNQAGLPTLSSPVVLRLAELYLNRAEAYAKLGETAKAIDDVNLIRRRAGLSGADLYTPTDLKGLPSVLDVVLQERRVELAFEGHRPYDLFRNNRSLVRNYPGYHNTATGQQTVPPDDKQVVHLVPESELVLNKNLKQNPL
ncbi:RagB/SusD family nutrient uptake outer membrane protein [Rudanella paleaurantiibacter]|uniref:RagB/SusD family nutrient uptake outer membrane protein n=1 Tax=Rudanella paleaurantiibacter TaxID=2614655 RepID=A0A7J5TWP8_9BACT|nr:RagB/SusD family nutrient uptake outer membrane protein [Rudanella paleaurantiibacter]KAB7728675.1 RagB/SusD family nutrient uptake outer membrane protein [Rudanella paleaurantiibacter]